MAIDLTPLMLFIVSQSRYFKRCIIACSVDFKVFQGSEASQVQHKLYSEAENMYDIFLV